MTHITMIHLFFAYVPVFLSTFLPIHVPAAKQRVIVPRRPKVPVLNPARVFFAEHALLDEERIVHHCFSREQGGKKHV